jgi:hypothetical protein
VSTSTVAITASVTTAPPATNATAGATTGTTTTGTTTGTTTDATADAADVADSGAKALQDVDSSTTTVCDTPTDPLETGTFNV